MSEGQKATSAFTQKTTLGDRKEGRGAPRDAGPAGTPSHGDGASACGREQGHRRGTRPSRAPPCGSTALWGGRAGNLLDGPRTRGSALPVSPQPSAVHDTALRPRRVGSRPPSPQPRLGRGLPLGGGGFVALSRQPRQRGQSARHSITYE